jgi:hypothetical protein
MLAIVGFWRLDVNPFGPVHEYAAPVTDPAVSASVPPAQRGLLLPMLGTTGFGRTWTATAALGSPVYEVESVPAAE